MSRDERYDDLAAQAEALDEACPVCSVESGSMCVGQVTGERMRAVHWQRISAARDVAEVSKGSSLDR